MQRIVDAFISLNLSRVGYKYVNIDDCWQVARMANQTIVEDPARFPSGMRALADYVHARGLQFGLYTAQTEQTCQNRPGSWEEEAVDAARYCDFGLDYIKIDLCKGQRYSAVNTSWIAFRKGIAQCVAAGGRDIFMSVEYCEYSTAPGSCMEWIADVADVWRTTGDIQANWASVGCCDCVIV